MWNPGIGRPTVLHKFKKGTWASMDVGICKGPGSKPPGIPREDSVFYYCHHKLLQTWQLKQHKLTILQFCSLTRLNSRCWQGCIFFWRLPRRSVSLLLKVIDRIQFLVFIGLGSSFPCWLSAQGSQLIDATHILSSIFKVNSGRLSPPHALNLSFFHLISLTYSCLSPLLLKTCLSILLPYR